MRTPGVLCECTAWRCRRAVPGSASCATAALLVACIFWQGPSAAEPMAPRAERAVEFHVRAQQRTGVLVPLYVYPGDVSRNQAYNRLIAVKRRYETVPVWVIVNPASGPGERVDDQYTRAIDRLCGAGCVVLGSVATGYGRRPPADVQADIDRWLEYYPRVHGIFFDEMNNEDSAQAADYQAALSRYAHDRGCWPTVANPGTDTPGRYFAAEAADVFVVHEGGAWPDEARLHGDRPGGYADYPPHTRGMLVHSQPALDERAL